MAQNDQTQNNGTRLPTSVRGAENFLRWSSSAMLRGGRMTKFKGQAASFSPELGLVALPTGLGDAVGCGRADPTLWHVRSLLRLAAAPLALLAAGSPAFAQAQDACIEVTPGNFVCEDNGNPATTEQLITGDNVSVMIEDSFAVDTTGAGGNALTVTATNSLLVQQIAGMSSLAGDEGIIAENLGTGELSLTTGGPVTGRAARGIYARQHGSGTDVIIDTRAGPVTGASDGIRARNGGIGALTITTADVTGATNGIYARNDGVTTDLTIDTSAGAVTGGSGIVVLQDGNGPLSVTTGDVTGMSYSGISVSNYYGSDFTIDTTAGTVTGRTDGLRIRSSSYGPLSITTADVNALGSSGSRGIYVSSDGSQATIDTTAGVIRGALDGIRALKGGVGVLSITTGDVSGSSGNGIFARQYALGIDLIIDSSAGVVSGYINGIYARNGGIGALTITTADVTGAIVGINARTGVASTDLTIDTSAGTVTGGTEGIFAQNLGTGALSITTGDVTGTTGRGLSASQGANGETVSIDTSAGTVTGGTDGIFARNYGSGALTITAADVAGLTGNGIDAEIRAASSYNPNTGTDLAIDTTAGTVTGANSGILARSDGRGALTITTGDVTGTGRNGIDASNTGAGTDLTIDTSAGAITGLTGGILARNNGTGALTITAGDVTATTGAGLAGRGISATNSSQGTNLTINTSGGTVTGTTDGIYARNNGSGSQSITTGDVTGATRHGVWVSQGSAGTDFTLDTSGGTITGGAFGIVAGNDGSGALSITTADVIARQGSGISARNTGTDLIIDTTAGTVTGTTEGIFARNYGSGVLSITTADVNAVGSSRRTGIDAAAGGNGLYIDSRAGMVSGDVGISAVNYGSGILSIFTADVSGRFGDGIVARQNNGGSDLIINTTAGSVSGYNRGISARNDGTGALSITTGDVSTNPNGIQSAGIYARNSGTDVTIDSSAGVVSGRYFGIQVNNEGTGEVSITTSDVTSTVFSGIFAQNYGTNLTIDTTAGDVTGGTYGIEAYNRGIGAASITTSDVTGMTAQGISAFQSSNGTSFTIDTTAGTVTGGTIGIVAGQYGSGPLTITTANVTGLSGTGIEALNSGDGLAIDTTAGTVSGGTLGIFAENRVSGGLTITTGTVTGGTDGIFARNNGTGALTITTGNVTGLTGTGIDAENSSDGTDLIIDTSTGAVTGGTYGITADNDGTGALLISTSDVTGMTAQGISAFQSSNGTSFTIDTTAGTVTGATFGIVAGQYGSGPLTITTANVTGLSDAGIEAINSGDGLVIDTTAGSVTGATTGIFARNNGAGPLSIITSNVTGTTRRGIDARNSANGTDFTIDTSAGAVVGASDGINAYSYSSGSLSITTSDVTGTTNNATGTTGIGIYARQSSAGNGLTINSSAGTVIGGYTGIFARHDGSGQLSIITGDVAGIAGRGIDARNTSRGTGFSINTSAGSVFGGNFGIIAGHNGTGALSITTGNVTGQSSTGIEAYSSGAGLVIDTTAGMVTAGIRGIAVGNFGFGDLSITTGAVTGGTDGIVARNYGTGALSISTEEVMGTAGFGIYAFNSGASTSLTIDTSAGAVFGGTDGIFARSRGNGALTITTADVTGMVGNGIDAEITAPNSDYPTTGTDLLIYSSSGAVSGGTNGILARNNGTGRLVITTGDVTGNTGSGIVAEQSFIGNGIVIDTSAGSVIGAVNGIFARNLSSSELSITTADVTGTSGNGIDASFENLRSQSFGPDLTINSSAGAVFGGTNGILARSIGNGALSITTGDVTGSSGAGIDAVNSPTSSSLTIDSSAGIVTGEIFGINAQSFGNNTLSITTGDVTGNTESGIFADQSSRGSGIGIYTTAGSVTGATHGIYARNLGGSRLTINTADVTGTSGNGIQAINGSLGSGLTIDSSTGAVSGGTNGINAVNLGIGALSITTGDVTGTTGRGIDATNFDNGTDLVIDTSAGVVSGGTNGIYAYNQGSGALSITTGNVTGISDDGVFARQGAGGGDLTFDSTAGVIVGSSAGIDLRNQGIGALSIMTGDVSGGGVGIVATNSNAGTDLTIDTTLGTVMGGVNGISARNAGSGALTITTGDVTGTQNDGIDVTNSSNGTDLIIDTTAGTVTGGLYGIYARSEGRGALSITTGDVTATRFYGIGVRTGARVSSVTIDTTAGAVTGASVGIGVRNSGIGALSITTGNVTGNTGTAIYARQYATGTDLIIDTRAGTVTGASTGITVRNSGIGALLITTGDVTGSTGNAINARQDVGGTDLVINTRLGTIIGGADAIFADNQSSGVLTITTGDVTGINEDGVFARQGPGGGDLTFDSTAGTITAGSAGIRLSNQGIGAQSITTGDVSGGGAGIIATNAINTTDLTIDTTMGTITGGVNGLSVRNSGSGVLTITTADVTGGRNDGIEALSFASDLIIDSTAGKVTGGTNGIYARQNGIGAVAITTGDVTGGSGTAIDARQYATGTDLTIDTRAGVVSGNVAGILAENLGSGILSITTADVNANGRGIDARQGSAGSDLVINSSAGTVNAGAGAGISARNDGTGAVSITTADVTSTLNNGITLTNFGADITIDTSAGAVSGEGYGILAINYGTGSASITTADVNGTRYRGILLFHDGSDVTIDTSAGAVSGGADGIDVRHNGSGALSITTGNVTGFAGQGIRAQNLSTGTDFTLDTSAGAVSGAYDGIFLRNNGSGALSITTADVTGTAGRGIDTSNSANGSAFTVDTRAGAVTGATHGIIVSNLGSGPLSITTADVTATSNTGSGISARNSGSGLGLSIDTSAGAVTAANLGIYANNSAGVLSIITGNVTGLSAAISAINNGTDLVIDTSAGALNTRAYGIDARQYGTGALTITTADVMGTADFGRGIDARNSANGTDITIDSSAGAVRGGYDAIRAINNGSGALSITTGDATGTRQRGINAINSANGTSLTINTSAGMVTGATDGIYVRNDGSGLLSVATADVTGLTGFGIRAENRSSGTDLAIDSGGGMVTGETYGILAYGNGTGALSITTGDVTGRTRQGLTALQSSNGTSFTIDTSAGTVTGASFGIVAGHYGSGALSITTADVTGISATGIEAISSGSGLAIDTSAGTVTGGTDGIFARNNGSGALTITTGDVTGNTGEGINAANVALGTDLTIDSGGGMVTGETYGILAYGNGTGALSITTGDVTGRTRQGLTAFQSSNGTSFTIDTSAGTLTGASFGIVAGHYGSGALSITTADVTGISATGIEAISSGSGLAIDTNAGTVTGATDGIFARNNGGGALTITTGDVTGTNGTAIYANNSGTDLTVNTTAGSVTGGTNGIYALNQGGGEVAITTNDVTGTQAGGIVALNLGTSLTIDTRMGAVIGGTDGIFADNQGIGSLTIATGNVTGSTGRGIVARQGALGTSLTINTSGVTVTGGTDGIVADHSGSGALSITVNDVTGLSGSGIYARSAQAGAEVTVQGSSGDIAGGTSGIQLFTADANILATNLDSVTGHAGDGIVLASTDGGSIGVSEIGTVLGTDGNGIIAASNGGSISIQAVGLVGGITGTGGSGIIADARGGMGGNIAIGTMNAIGNVSGAGGIAGAGILGLTDGTGMVAIDTSTSTIAGTTAGIEASAGGTGSVTINSGTVSSSSGVGIMARANGGDIAFNTLAGPVTGASSGIIAMQDGAGSISILAGNVTGTGVDGIAAQGSGGDITLDTLAGTITAGRSGLVAIQNGTGAVDVRAADVLATSGAAIQVQTGTTAGPVTIDTLLGDIEGGQDGIMAINGGTGATTILTANVTGGSRYGVIAMSAQSATDLVIDTTAGTVTSGANGIAAMNSGTGALMIMTSDVTSATASGIFGFAGDLATDLTIDSTAGTVVADATGIFADHRGSGMLAITTGDVIGSTGVGIFARSRGAATGVSLDSTGGTISGGAAGIMVQSGGMGPATITTGNVIGTGGAGIDASGAGSALVIDTTRGTVAGATDGIRAGTSTGEFMLTTADVIGMTAAGVNVTSGGTDAVVDVTMGAIIGGTDGISVANSGTGMLTVTAADVSGLVGSAIRAAGAASTNGITLLTTGTIVGGETGITATNDGNSPTFIVSDGIIAANSGEALRIGGTAGSLVTNNGELLGFVTFGEGADSLTNNGMFLTAGDSAFGTGIDILTNNNAFVVSSTASTSITGLESFANNGLVSLANGGFGNNLAVSGDFIGGGNSVLSIDVDFDAELADRLTVGGAATGSSLVSLSPAGLLPNGLISSILVVDADTGTSSTAFGLAGGRQTIGLIVFDVVFDPSGNDFLLATGPSQAALQLGNLPETSRNIWTQSASAFSDHMNTVRDSGGSVASNTERDRSTHLWLTAYGSSLEREGVVDTVFNRITGTSDLGYNQNFFGFLAGADFGTDKVRYGVAGGYLQSEVDFAGTPNGTDYDAFSLGVYVAADLGRLWTNAIAKYDVIGGTLQSNTGGLTADLNGSAFGIQAEAGALFGDRRSFFFEPGVSFSYASTDLEEIATAQGTFAFDAGHSILTKAGARFGSGFDLGKTTAAIFAGVNYVHEFDGEDEVTFATGPNSVSFGNIPINDYAEVSAGILIGKDGDAITGSLQGHVLVGEETNGVGGSLNLRYRF